MNKEHIENIANDIRAAKLEEDTARKRRCSLEAQLIVALDVPEEEGSYVFEFSGLKTTIMRKMTRTVVPGVLAKVARRISKAVLASVVKQKPALDLRAYRQLEDTDPRAYVAISQALSVKPAKPSVKIERL